MSEHFLSLIEDSKPFLRRSAIRKARMVRICYKWIDSEDIEQDCILKAWEDHVAGTDKEAIENPKLFTHRLTRAFTNFPVWKKARLRLDRKTRVEINESSIQSTDCENGLGYFENLSLDTQSDGYCVTQEEMTAMKKAFQELPQRLLEFLNNFINNDCDMVKAEKASGLSRKTGNAYMRVIREAVEKELGRRVSRTQFRSENPPQLESIIQCIREHGGAANVVEIIKWHESHGFSMHPKSRTRQNRMNQVIQKNRSRFKRIGTKKTGKWALNNSVIKSS